MPNKAVEKLKEIEWLLWDGTNAGEIEEWIGVPITYCFLNTKGVMKAKTETPDEDKGLYFEINGQPITVRPGYVLVKYAGEFETYSLDSFHKHWRTIA